MSRLTCRIFFSHKLFVVINKVNNIISTTLSQTCRCKGALQLPFCEPFCKMTTHWSSLTNLNVLWREYKNRLYWEEGVTDDHSGDIGGHYMGWACVQYVTCWQLAAAWGVTLKRSIDDHPAWEDVAMYLCFYHSEHVKPTRWFAWNLLQIEVRLLLTGNDYGIRGT